MLSWVALAVLAASCTSEPIVVPSDAAPQMYVDVQLNHGVDEIDGPPHWAAAVFGHVLTEPWRGNGRDVALGTCSSWGDGSTGSVIAIAWKPILVIDGLGAYPLTLYNDGELDIAPPTTLPASPFLSAGTPVRLAIGSAVLATDAPPFAALVAPPPESELNLRLPIHFEWKAQGEDHVTLTLSLFSRLFEFARAITCTVPDTGSFDLPPVTGPIDSRVALANLYLTTEHHAEAPIGEMSVVLLARQFTIRRYAIAGPGSVHGQ